jgi:hypothetical protein
VNGQVGFIGPSNGGGAIVGQILQEGVSITIVADPPGAKKLD